MKCSSCNVNISAKKNFTQFYCPSCGKELIVRCSTCKNLSIKYICKCGFLGP